MVGLNVQECDGGGSQGSAVSSKGIRMGRYTEIVQVHSWPEVASTLYSQKKRGPLFRHAVLPLTRITSLSIGI